MGEKTKASEKKLGVVPNEKAPVELIMAKVGSVRANVQELKAEIAKAQDRVKAYEEDLAGYALALESLTK